MCVSACMCVYVCMYVCMYVAMSRTRWQEVLNEGAKAIDESLNNKYKIRQACQKGLSSPSKSKVI